MKAKTIIAILIIVLLLVLLCGCDKPQKAKDFIQNSDRFVLLETQDVGVSSLMYILCDKETHVMYGMMWEVGMTVMLDADGKPLLYEGEL